MRTDRRIARNRVARKLLSPLTRFMQLEASSGILLIITLVAALSLANSPASDAYFRLLSREFAIQFGTLEVRESLQLWINDLLMAGFFLVVGLEIKREALVGELNSIRLAALPLMAAIGGMVVPALIYVAMNWGGEGLRGWGIPMATDIAFSLGVLALIGSRAPSSLKVFLTAFAIVDDLGAVLVIAIVYTASIAWGYLGWAAAILGLMMVCNVLGVRNLIVYSVLGLVLWFCMLESGVHATIAGVLTALAIPAWTRRNSEEFVSAARNELDGFEALSEGHDAIESELKPAHAEQAHIERLERLCEQAQMPLERMEQNLHPWVTFGIVPLFAFANAGVRIEGDIVALLTHPIALGITLGLFLGKPIGVGVMSLLSTRLKLAEMPRGMARRHLVGTGFLGGIGFTMSLFVATLAFKDPRLLDTAKAGLLLGSLMAGVVGFVLLRMTPSPAPEAEAAAR